METKKPHHKPYYEDLGLSHDQLLRCDECEKLIRAEILYRDGCCPKCGNKRVKEVKTLSLLEWLRIKLGFLRFKYSDLFLKEFRK